MTGDRGEPATCCFLVRARSADGPGRAVYLCLTPEAPPYVTDRRPDDAVLATHSFVVPPELARSDVDDLVDGIVQLGEDLLVVSSDDGETAFPPFDGLELARPATPVKGATFTMQRVERRTIFGDVAHWFTVTNGLVTDGGIGQHASPDITIELDALDALAERTGGVRLLDIVDRLVVEGDLPLLMLACGLAEAPGREPSRAQIDRLAFASRFTELVRTLPVGAWPASRPADRTTTADGPGRPFVDALDEPSSTAPAWVGTVDPSVESIVNKLEWMVAGGALLRGVQLYVSVGGETLIDGATGLDGRFETLTPEVLLATYCAQKPLLALCVASLVQAREVSYDDAIGDVIDEVPAAWDPHVRAATIGQLLTHTAGVPHPFAVEAPFRSERELAMDVVSLPRPRGWISGQHAAYSEVRAWHLLAGAIESLTGNSYVDEVERRVLVPLRLQHAMIHPALTPDDYDRWEPRIGCNVDLCGAVPIPMLHERAPSWALRRDPAVGGYATARGLGQFYEALLGLEQLPLDVDHAEVLRASLRPQRPRMVDLTLGMRCQFGFGFMVGLSDFGFGALSPESFGHAGYSGTCWALADRERELVVAINCIGVLDPDTAIRVRRKQINGWILDAVDAR